MELFLLYLWTRLDTVQIFLYIALFTSIATSVSAGIAYLDNNCMSFGESYKQAAKTSIDVFKMSLKAVVGLAIAILIIPSQKDAAIIAGGWLTKEIATSKTAQEIGSKTLQLIQDRLDFELKKVQDETEQD